MQENNRTKEHHVKRTKPGIDTQVLHDLIYIWKIKKWISKKYRIKQSEQRTVWGEGRNGEMMIDGYSDTTR